MGIKDLFDKGHSLKFVKNKTKDDLSESVESYRYIGSYSKRRDRFIPDVDFTTASNFARFGLAEEYYDSTIKRIYQTYPYDGSQAEKIEWENDSTYLDLFIFENEYPRANGYVSMGVTSSFTGAKDSSHNVYLSYNPQYIFMKGGPNADANGDYKSEFSAGPAKTGISKANIYHTASQRTNNLELDLAKGVTVEFWMKKEGWASTSAAHNEYIFHLWNSGTLESTAAARPLYNGSLRAYVNGQSATNGNVFVKAVSGSTTLAFTHDTGLSDIADSKWHHYAFTLKTEGSDTLSHLYVDGHHESSLKAAGSTMATVTGSMVAALGGLVGPLTGSLSIGKDWGNIASASFDEFRYWKTSRGAQQIGRFYRDQVGGGTNTDNVKYDDMTNKVDLGVYYKFNEGITTQPGVDSTILDYSGRVSNGEFVNYISTSRNTGSAIVLSNAATREFKDPVIYSSHPDVVSLAAQKAASGSMHDHENSVSIYKSMPAWILEEDESESKNLRYLTQIIASFFDDLYLQIEKLSKLKDINYPDDTNYEKPLPFADRLLSSRGYDAPELFANASDLAKYLERDEKKLFEKKLYEVKNIIYQNIYNNLSYIQKSKGTFKSLRNFLRCFGIDEELVKLNIYSNNGVYEFKENTTNTSIRKKYLDFDDLETRYTSSSNYADAYTATAYQYYNADDSNSLSYIPAATESFITGAMMTIETEVIFPKRSIVDDKNYQMFPATTSSIFGLHAVVASNTDLTYAGADTIDFSVHATKPDDDRRNVKFALGGSSVFSTISNSSSYAGVYDNQKWNLAFRLRPTKARRDGGLLFNNSAGFVEPYSEGAYTYELYGVNYLSNILQNEFLITGSMSLTNAITFFTQPKRIFLGAERTNFTGSVQKYSDVKVSSTRVWLDYLPDEVIRAHARDADSYGALQPYRNANDSLNTNYVPQISTLILNWTMDNVTGSDASGQFLIEDFASGSANSHLRFGDSWAEPLSRYNYSGRADKFTADANFVDQAVDINFVLSAKQKLPEVVNSDDMVKILNKQDDMVFTRDTTYIQHLLSVEKSMYQTISEEMLRLFATITNFNNLVGEPVNRYRPYYKKMEKLRELFFESVENERLDLEKFIEYFKWIDDAVAIMIAQLIPVSSNSVELLRNMVESHILERNKYWTKFPTLDVKTREPVSSLKAIEELKYSWKFGHAPVAADQNTNQDQSCLWWKQRAERDGVLKSGDANVDADRKALLKIAITEVTGSEPTLQTSAAAKYSKSYYYNRSLGRAIDLEAKRSLTLKAGANSSDNNLHDFYKGVIKWASDDDFIYLDVDNKLKEAVCNDKIIPDELNKKKFKMKALVMTAAETSDSNASGSGKNDLKYTDAKSTLVLPFQMYSSSVTTGYQNLYYNQFGLDFTNMHEDKYGPVTEIPMQGPFTEKYVGGMQHRHVKLNQGTDTILSRPEGWHLQTFLNNTSTSEVILDEDFGNATTSATTDVTILNIPRGDYGANAEDPSPYEYWINGSGSAEQPWSFLKGATPTAGTGPGFPTGVHAYCEVYTSRVGQKFGLVTPLIDLLDISQTTRVTFSFYYHMHGTGIGNLRIQASHDPSFESGVKDLTTYWDTAGSRISSAVLAGEQHGSPTVSYKLASVTANVPGTPNGLTDYVGKRFYLRFLYTAGPTHLGDCSITNIGLQLDSGYISRNSFKLLNPTYDDHHRPTAVYTRDTLVKRPVNIKNIEMAGNSPTTAGNYLDRYEYVNTTSPEANDPYFVKNTAQITKTTTDYTAGSIQTILSKPPSAVPMVSPTGYNPLFTLPDRTFLTGSIRNRTRIKARFSSPGGFETLSRRFVDPAHETFSPNNVLTFRNAWPRKVYNTQLQAHQGQYGVSSHRSSWLDETARVYGSPPLLESTGSITAASYELTDGGGAAKHKYHRNNIERIEFTGDDPEHRGASFVTASSFNNAFVSHMIPRTDQQMRWITASII